MVGGVSRTVAEMFVGPEPAVRIGAQDRLENIPAALRNLTRLSADWQFHRWMGDYAAGAVGQRRRLHRDQQGAGPLCEDGVENGHAHLQAESLNDRRSLNRVET